MTIVGIGASAGGLGALKTLFARLPGDTGLAFVVVVHLSPQHESHLANLLQPFCVMPVRQVTDSIALEPNQVYVIPPGANLNTIDTHLRLSRLEDRPRDRAPIDHFFRTLADTHDGRSIAVVLTGTGSDGSLGLRRIKEAGGITIAQSPEQAEYDGMPRSAIATGMVDRVLTLEEIPREMMELIAVRPHLAISEPEEAPEPDQSRLLQKIYAHLHAQTGHDFSRYKPSTIMRRLARRMQLQHVEALADYLELLRKDPKEVRQLFNDLLITVTEFFRDREVFERLAREVIPRLFQGKGAGDRLRVWSIGCSTGEEAYSLAMLLLEEAGRHDEPPQIQIFASDLHDAALRSAREGIYPKEIAADVTAQRLRRFFVAENDHYRVRREVRELVIFTAHNLLSDPPFSHIDLIVCRNLLIYLQRDVQEDVARLFHYALRPEGLLLLGKSERVDRTELFACEDKEICLFRRRHAASREPHLPPFPVNRPRGGRGAMAERGSPPEQVEGRAGYGVIHERVVERYAPPSVLVNGEWNIVHASARAGRYLQVPGGEPTQNVLRLVRPPLQIELRTALHRAGQTGQPTHSEPIRVPFNGESGRVILRVQPALDPDLTGYFLVIFDEVAHEPESKAPADPQAASAATMHELQAELDLNRQRLLATIEEYESNREEMQASNEELQSANEELRSTMEELETSKEELQSMNEELATLNQENRHRVEEFSQLAGDLQNLLTATDIATLFLDRELRIVRFTPKVSELFNIRHTDRGRPLSDLTHHLDYPEFQSDARAVLTRLVPIEREVFCEAGAWYLVRILPYRTADDRIDGVVITLIDITERKRGEEETARAREYAENIIATLHEALLVLNPDLTVRSANAAFYEQFRVQPDQTEGRKIYDLGNGQWNIPALRKLLEEVLPANQVFSDYEVSHTFESLGRRVMLLNGRRLDHMQLILLGIRDITERKVAEQAIVEARDQLEQRIAQRTAELERQARRLRELGEQVASAEHRERKRLAAVLHDELQQYLVAAKMRLEHLQDSLHASPASEPVAAVADILLQAINCSRDLTRRLRPPVLYEDGLVPALRWLAGEMGARHELTVTVTCEGEEPPLNDHLKVMLFEAVRELLFNVVKHAGVREAAVSLTCEEGDLKIVVDDRGRGIDQPLKGQGRGQGLGLFAIGERLEALGGRMAIERLPAGGTRITLFAPVSAAEAAEAEDPLESAAAEEPSLTGSGAAAGNPTASAAPVAGPQPRVAIVDDHAIVRQGIATLLAADPRVQVVAEAANGLEAIEAVEAHRPDVVLMDVNMPRLNGVDATRRITQQYPAVKVIGLSVQEDQATAQSMRDAGAVGFVPKSGNAGNIVSLILRLTGASSETQA